jgi:MFS family permease
VGPALAGAVYGTAGSAAVFGFDTVTFVVAAALLFMARPRVFEPEPGEGTFREIAAGFRYVASVPWLWISICIATFALMVAMAPYQSLLPALVEQHFGRGVGSYSFLFAVQAAGMVVGTLCFGQLNPRRHRVVITYGLFALNDLCVIVMALLPSFALAVGLVAVRGFCIGFGIGLWETLLMELVPESKLSRVISLDFFGSLGLTPVGFALVAILSGFLPPSTILVTGFSIALVLWTAPLALRRVREAA